MGAATVAIGSNDDNDGDSDEDEDEDDDDMNGTRGDERGVYYSVMQL